MRDKVVILKFKQNHFLKGVLEGFSSRKKGSLDNFRYLSQVLMLPAESLEVISAQKEISEARSSMRRRRRVRIFNLLKM